MSEKCCAGLPRKKLCCRECEQSHISKLEIDLAEEQARSRRLQAAYNHANVEALNIAHIPKPVFDNEIGYLAGAKFIMTLWEAALSPDAGAKGE